MTLEVLSAGVPVLAHKGFTRMNIADFLPPNAIFWGDQKEFFDILLNLTEGCLNEQSQSALDYFNEYHSMEKVGRLLQENIGLPEPDKYIYPDNSLIDITTSFQLFGNNYKIEIIDKEYIGGGKKLIGNKRKIVANKFE